jgi:hypothetical protein
MRKMHKTVQLARLEFSEQLGQTKQLESKETRKAGEVFCKTSAVWGLLFSAPKGYTMKAQGNALGQERQTNGKP